MSARPITMTDIEQLGERAQDLLVERTLWGLDPAQETELSVAVSDVEGLAYEFERTVGALCVGMHASDEPESLPADMRSRLSTLASGPWARQESSDAGVADAALSDSGPLRLTGAGAAPVAAGGSAGPLQWLGWLAAAACLTYAIFVTTPSSGPVAGVGGMWSRGSPTRRM